MAFKLVTVFCATLAFAHAGLLAPTYSPANEVSTVYSSIGSIGHQQVLAHGGPVLAAHSAPIISAHSAPVVAAHSAPLIAAHSAPLIAAHSAPVLATRTYAAAAPVISAPIARVAYSPANEVSQVYSSIAAPQLAYGSHSQLAYASPAIGTSQQSTIRSLGGTISSYSKAVDTPFSSVRKSDTRISNNYYTPALATKTIAYQQPAIIEQKSIPATVVSHVTFDGLGTHYAW